MLLCLHMLPKKEKRPSSKPRKIVLHAWESSTNIKLMQLHVAISFIPYHLFIFSFRFAFQQRCSSLLFFYYFTSCSSLLRIDFFLSFLFSLFSWCRVFFFFSFCLGITLFLLVLYNAFAKSLLSLFYTNKKSTVSYLYVCVHIYRKRKINRYSSILTRMQRIVAFFFLS